MSFRAIVNTALTKVVELQRSRKISPLTRMFNVGKSLPSMGKTPKLTKKGKWLHNVKMIQELESSMTPSSNDTQKLLLKKFYQLISELCEIDRYEKKYSKHSSLDYLKRLGEYED